MTRLRVAPYTYERQYGPPVKDPVNVAFRDMEGGLHRVQQILEDAGFTARFGVGDQWFAEPDRDGVRRRQDWNRATSLVGWLGRDHIRVYELFREARRPAWIVGSIHRERWPEFLGWIRRPCDAVESFVAPRKDLEQRLATRFSVGTIDLGNRAPMPQCSKDWPGNDGLVLIVGEPE
jgi:hypothetical protein